MGKKHVSNSGNPVPPSCKALEMLETLQAPGILDRDPAGNSLRLLTLWPPFCAVPAPEGARQ